MHVFIKFHVIYLKHKSMDIKHKEGPCLDKKCSWCCDPIRVKRSFPNDKIPRDKDGKKIWIDREEIQIPESHPDTVKLKTFDCVNLDNETGECKDYQHRPEICKNSGCINEASSESIDQQHKKTINEKFISISQGKRK